MLALGRLHRRALFVRLEWDDLEWHAEHLGHFFFKKASCLMDFIARPPQTAAHDLLAEQLRQERPQADDMSHRVAVPTFGEHADTHNTAHIPPRWVQRTT